MLLVFLCIPNPLLLINSHQRIIWCFPGCWWSWSVYAHWAASTQSKSLLCASKTRNSHLCFLKFGMSTSEPALHLQDRMRQCQENMGGQGSSTDRTQGHDVLKGWNVSHCHKKPGFIILFLDFCILDPVVSELLPLNVLLIDCMARSSSGTVQNR